MSPELGAALIGLITAVTAFVKSYTGQSSMKKNFEAEIKVLQDRVARLDKLDEKFDKLNENVVEVKTQLGMLLKINNIVK